MTSEIIKIPLQREVFNKLSNSSERSEYIETLVAKHEESLKPVIEWHINDIEDTVDYSGCPDITAELDNASTRGVINIQFILHYYSGCSDTSYNHELEEILGFTISEDLLVLTFEHPKEFRVYD